MCAMFVLGFCYVDAAVCGLELKMFEFTFAFKSVEFNP